MEEQQEVRCDTCGVVLKRPVKPTKAALETKLKKLGARREGLERDLNRVLEQEAEICRLKVQYGYVA